MYKARYYKNDGTEAGDRDLPIWLFDGIVNDHVLHQAVRAYLLNQRQGSASAKTRSEVRGGSRKPWRQKGTGRARHGTIRSPIWEGGGITFPPKPKSWRIDLPKKVKRLAKRSAYNARAEDDRVLLIAELSFEEPKTRRLREALEAIGVEEKVLLLTAGVKKNVYLSGRNLPTVKVMPFGEESAYDLLWASTVLIEEPALESATEEAEAEGLDEKAEHRIAKAEARAQAEAEAEAAARPGRRKKKAAAPKAEEKEAKVQKPEPEEEVEEAAEKEAAEAVAEKEEEEAEAPAAEAEEEKAEEAEAAPDVSEIELPTVKELADFLADFDDVETIRGLQDRDDRKTAQKHYDDRIAELTGEEG